MTQQVGLCLKMTCSRRKPRKITLRFKNAFRVKKYTYSAKCYIVREEPMFKLKNLVFKRNRYIKMIYFVKVTMLPTSSYLKRIEHLFMTATTEKEARGQKHRFWIWNGMAFLSSAQVCVPCP